MKNIIVHKKNITKILVIFFVTFAISFVSSKSSHAQNIKSIDDYITDNNSNEAQELIKLVTELNPSIYVENGTVKTYGKRPTNLFTNVSSFADLQKPEILKNNIQIIRITVETRGDLNQTIDLSSLSNYYKLKYIYIFSLVPCTENDISNMVLNNDEYSIFYKIDNGDTNQ